MRDDPTVMTLDPRRIEQTIRELCRQDLSVFVETAYRILNDDLLSRNWHITAIADQKPS